MAAQTPDGRIAALQRAREARTQAFIQQVDPTGELAASDPDELRRQVADLSRDWYANLARKSHDARRANRRRKEAFDAATQAASIAVEAVLKAYAKAGVA